MSLQLRKLLESALKERIDTHSERMALIEQGVDSPTCVLQKGRNASKMSAEKDYLPYINEFADPPTIHEAYQYLIKVYIDNIIELRKKMRSTGLKLGAMTALRKKSITPAEQSHEETEEEKAKREQKEKEKREREAEELENKKIMGQIEDLVGTLGVDDLDVMQSGSRSRRGSRVPPG